MVRYLLWLARGVAARGPGARKGAGGEGGAALGKRPIAFQYTQLRENFAVFGGPPTAHRRGKRLGRPAVTDRRKRERICRLRRSGHTVPAIADQVGVSRATVERVLRSAMAGVEAR